MSALSLHAKYVQDLRKKRSDPFYMTMANKKTRAISGAYSEARDSLKETYGSGLPANAIAEVMQQTTDNQVSDLENVYDSAQSSEELRRKQLEPVIQGAEAKHAELKEAKKKEDDAKKFGFIKGALQVGGTVVGAALGAPGIGSALGGLASGFIGNEVDMGQVQQGLVDTVGAFTSLKYTNANEKAGGAMMGVIQNYSKYNPEQQQQIETGIEMFGRDPEKLYEFFNNFQIGG